jgi:uncharacterized coiled-coil protein SlyX
LSQSLLTAIHRNTAPTIMTSRHVNDQKPRISKTEKIAELQSKLKLLAEENKQLNRESKKNSLSARQDAGDNIERNSESSGKSRGERDKLKEALRALKRVTVKQEMSLATLRQRSKQRRGEIEQKDKIMRKLQEENKAYRIAHEKIRENNGNDDLRARLADLELQLAKEENTKAEQSEKLKEREAGITSLQAKLSKNTNNKGGSRGVSRTTSSDSSVGGLSMASASSSITSAEDVGRMKRDLAKKMEKITNLQHELEACKDEIHDLKQKDRFSSAFPMTPAQGDDDDFFDDDDGDNDVWAAF